MLRERTLADLIGGQAGVHGSLAVSDISTTSSGVQPGGLFVAVRGRRSHGLEYADEAVSRGAVAIVFEPAEALSPPEGIVAIPVAGLTAQLGSIAVNFFGNPAARQSIAAVTGTNGKTTVAFLIASAADQLGLPCGYLGTLGAGVPTQLAPSMLTTPDCFELHRALFDLFERSARHVALEVSSHAIDQGRIAGVDFQTAVFTNLSRDHLDYHGDLDSYGRTKAKLFAAPGLCRAVINVDDPFGEQLARRVAPGLKAVAVTLRPSIDVPMARRLEGEARVLDAGLQIRYRSPWGDGTLESPLIGAFNAENLLLALGVLISWGIDHGRASEALSACPVPPGRMETFSKPAGTGPRVVVDFAHTPAALAKALEVLRATTPGRLWCVFGCGGERDAGKRPLMGAAAARWADQIVLTNDNPRGEAPEHIAAQIRGGIGSHPAVSVQLDRGLAIRDSILAAQPEDTVLVAGRGHEAYQLIGDSRLLLCDRAVVTQVLEGLS